MDNVDLANAIEVTNHRYSFSSPTLLEYMGTLATYLRQPGKTRELAIGLAKQNYSKDQLKDPYLLW
jgi:hypothetical protein